MVALILSAPLNLGSALNLSFRVPSALINPQTHSPGSSVTPLPYPLLSIPGLRDSKAPFAGLLAFSELGDPSSLHCDVFQSLLRQAEPPSLPTYWPLVHTITSVLTAVSPTPSPLSSVSLTLSIPSLHLLSLP